MNKRARYILKEILSYITLGCLAAAIGFGAVHMIKRVESQPMTLTGDYRELVNTVGSGKPIMVTLAGCPHCEDARAWLKLNHVSVTEIRIGSNPEVQKALAEKQVQSTPTLITASSMTVGFVPDSWSKILGSPGN